MKLPLSSVFRWQVLRVLTRNGNVPTSGRDLRIYPSPWSKDGTFLDWFVDTGLLEVVEQAEPTEPRFPGSKSEPVQFRNTYRLTSMGEECADTGEYERPLTLAAATRRGAVRGRKFGEKRTASGYSADCKKVAQEETRCYEEGQVREVA